MRTLYRGNAEYEHGGIDVQIGKSVGLITGLRAKINKGSVWNRGLEM